MGACQPQTYPNPHSKRIGSFALDRLSKAPGGFSTT